MATDPGFLEHVLDLFSPLGQIRTGRMFGGTSLYLDDAMFAVIFGDQVFMKSDAELAPEYSGAGSQPFAYETRGGERVIPGLMSLPEPALEDPEEALSWAQLSLRPARDAARKRAKGK